MSVPEPRRSPVRAPLVLPGWSPRSRWGWDPTLECYWASLETLGPGAPVLVAMEHLVPTLASLARSVAVQTALDEGTVFVALTGGRTALTCEPVPAPGAPGIPRQARGAISA
jgi:hypothetical protein